MRMSELVSSLGLWIYPVIGLVGFLASFAIVLLRVARTGRQEMTANGMIPLEDGTIESEGGRS